MVRYANRPRPRCAVARRLTPCETYHFRGDSLHAPYDQRLRPPGGRHAERACYFSWPSTNPHRPGCERANRRRALSTAPGPRSAGAGPARGPFRHPRAGRRDAWEPDGIADIQAPPGPAGRSLAGRTRCFARNCHRCSSQITPPPPGTRQAPRRSNDLRPLSGVGPRLLAPLTWISSHVVRESSHKPPEN
jgi:hypothetical protein